MTTSTVSLAQGTAPLETLARQAVEQYRRRLGREPDVIIVAEGSNAPETLAGLPVEHSRFCPGDFGKGHAVQAARVSSGS